MSNSLTATLKYAQISDKKMALIAKLVSGKKVDDALTVLQFLPKKWASILYKVVRSAYANAKNNAKANGELYIKTVNVSKGPKIKRYRFASRSRVHKYIKHRSFVRVVLGEK